METNTTNKQLVLSFFSQHPLMTLTTMSPDGVPQNAVVYVHMDGDLSCYLVSRETTRKYTNITDNGMAVLSAYDENVLMYGELTGRAEVVDDADTIFDVIGKLHSIISSRKSTYWVPPVKQLEGHSYVTFKIKPTHVRFLNYELSSSTTPEPHKVEIEL